MPILNRGVILCLSLSILAVAGTKVGVFDTEIKQAFAVADGLPSDEVLCVAAVGSQVFAGTAKGLIARDAKGWTLQRETAGSSVQFCAAAPDALYFTFNGSLEKLSGNSITRVAALPPGIPRSLAVSEGAVWMASSAGLYRLSAGVFRAITLPAGIGEVRQIALGPRGSVAVAASQGLFVLKALGASWTAVHPRSSERSWAPVDVRGVTFDSKGRLWFASPQGVGCADGGTWALYTGLDGLPYDDFTTLAPGGSGDVWFGTSRGAVRFDGSTWAYRQGLRWLPDDGIRGITVSPNQDAWFATSKGIGVIKRRPITLAGKAKYFEDEIDRYHRRTEYQYVMSVDLERAGDKSSFVQTDSDNDGLWTSMYGAGECFAYAAAKDPAAKRRARKAFEALRFLSQVTQGGDHPAPPGFPARSILPTSGRDPNRNDSQERDIRKQGAHDRLWKVMSPRWPKSADGKWYWKTDTSSDELDGHYFFYAQYYDLVAETPREKEEVRQVVQAITDHLVDHDLNLVDWDGKVTRWAIFSPAELNTNSNWWPERGLNSLSVLSYLKAAEHITGNAKYRDVYDTLVRKHGYVNNAMTAKLSTGLGSGNQSDDEMAFMNYYNLIKYEQDAGLRSCYAYSLSNYWGLERPEMNPFFNFIAAASLTGQRSTSPFVTSDLTPQGDWLEDSIDTLKRIPLDRLDWAHTNAHRKDIVPLRGYVLEDADMLGSGHRRNGKVLPADERFFSFWNHNPYRLDTGGSGRSLADGAVFLLPYYMGLYHHYIED